MGSRKRTLEYEYECRFERAGQRSLTCLIRWEINPSEATCLVDVEEVGGERKAVAAAEYQPLTVRGKTVGYALLETALSADCNHSARLSADAEGSLRSAAMFFSGRIASRAVDQWLGPREP